MSGKLSILAIVVIFGALGVLCAPTGSLAEEKGKKLEPGDPGYTYTNEDLQSLKRDGVSVLGGGVGYASVAPANKPHPEEWWRDRTSLHNDRLSKVEADLASTQDRLNKASNPFTRALAGTITDEEGNERLATVADLQSELERLQKIRQSEIRGLQQLRQAARKSGVPEDWVGGHDWEAKTGSNSPEPPPLVVRPDGGRAQP